MRQPVNAVLTVRICRIDVTNLHRQKETLIEKRKGKEGTVWTSFSWGTRICKNLRSLFLQLVMINQDYGTARYLYLLQTYLAPPRLDCHIPTYVPLQREVQVATGCHHIMYNTIPRLKRLSCVLDLYRFVHTAIHTLTEKVFKVHSRVHKPAKIHEKVHTQAWFIEGSQLSPRLGRFIACSYRQVHRL